MLKCILVQEETSQWVGVVQQYFSSGDFLTFRAASSAPLCLAGWAAFHSSLNRSHTHTNQHDT